MIIVIELKTFCVKRRSRCQNYKTKMPTSTWSRLLHFEDLGHTEWISQRMGQGIGGHLPILPQMIWADTMEGHDILYFLSRKSTITWIKVAFYFFCQWLFIFHNFHNFYHFQYVRLVMKVFQAQAHVTHAQWASTEMLWIWVVVWDVPNTGVLKIRVPIPWTSVVRLTLENRWASACGESWLLAPFKIQPWSPGSLGFLPSCSRLPGCFAPILPAP